MLDAASKENPGKPFFVIDHIPPRATVYRTSPIKGNRRLLLEKYPNAVVFCGHIHGKYNIPRTQMLDGLEITLISALPIFLARTMISR